MANEIEIPLKLSGVQSLKAELRTLKAAIAEASDPEQMAALAARAGEVADRIKDANDAVNVFASGSKFEQISNSFGGIRDSIMSLDFEEASDKAKVFAKNLGGLNAGEISKSMKGLTSTVTTMGGAFVKLGAQILVNPIFLLTATIAAIVTILVLFLKKIGVLDKIFNTISAALKPLIDGFKQLTEWLGLSTAASDDAAEKVKANNEKIVESSKKRAESQGKAIDQEIQLAQSLGKQTERLEIEKTQVTEREAKVRIRDTQKALRELGNKVGVLADQERTRLRKQLKDDNELVRQSQVDRQVIINKSAQEAKQKQSEEDKKEAEEAAARAKARRDKYKEGAAAIQKEIDAANKLVVDSTKTQQQREIDDVKTKYEALIKEAKKYKKDVTGLQAAQELEIAAINKEAADKELERQKELAKQLSDFQNAELDRAEAIQESIYQAGLTARQKELEERTYYYDNLIAEANRYGLDTTVLQEQQRKDLAEINKKFDDQEKQIAIDKINQEKAVRDAKIEIANSIATGLGAIGEAFIKDQKKLEQFNKAQALIQIGIDTAKAISSLVAMSNANPLNSVTAGAAGIAQYAAGIVQIVTNIAKAKALLTNPSSTPSTNSTPTGGGGGGTSMSSSVPSFVPGNLFGQGNAANNATSAQSVETTSNITVTAVVSETEMTGVQNKVNKILKNAVL